VISRIRPAPELRYDHYCLVWPRVCFQFATLAYNRYIIVSGCLHRNQCAFVRESEHVSAEEVLLLLFCVYGAHDGYGAQRSREVLGCNLGVRVVGGGE